VRLAPTVAFSVFEVTSALQGENISPVGSNALGLRSIKCREYSPSVRCAEVLNPRCGHACVICPGLLGREQHTGILRERRRPGRQQITANKRGGSNCEPHTPSPDLLA